MTYVERHIINVATDASGDYTGYTPVITGKIANIIYDKTDFDNGVDFNITLESTTQNLWVESDVNASKTVAPRQKTHDTVGVGQVRTLDGGQVEDAIVAADDRVKVVVSNGGNVKTGKITIIVE